jgi:Ca2+-binding RTX toxin-like protein
MLVSAGNTDTINAGTGVDTLILSGAVPGNQAVVVDLSQADQVVSIGSTLDVLVQTNCENLTASGLGGFVTATGSTGDNVIIGSRGDDGIDGGAGDDTLTGGSGNDQLDGGEGDDTLDGGLGQDTVTGGGGDDRIAMLVTGGHVDTLDAGTDADTLVLSGGVPGNRQVAVNLSSVTDQVVSIGGVAEGLAQTGFEHLDASGVGGSVLVTGSAGDNVIVGSRGNDTLVGGDGDDTYVIGQGTDTLTEQLNEGTDTVQSSISHVLGTNFESLTLTGGRTINGTGNELANILTGNNAANILSGGAGHDTLTGNGGNDRLDGGTGDDAMDGGAGSDTYLVDSLGDTVTESVAGASGGTDLVQSAVDFQLGTNVERLTLTGTADINGTGNGLNNILVGNSGHNVLDGGAGTDRMAGGLGNDTYVADVATDVIVEATNAGVDTVQSSSHYTLGANIENLTLTGTADSRGTGNGLSNVLIGNSGNNQLTGGGGHDVLEGEAGNDTLIGGSGNDTYEFALGDGEDLVQDTSGTADAMAFDGGIDPMDLVLTRHANHLRIAIQGTSDQVTIQNWYTSSANRIETIEAGNGDMLLSTQVDQLLQAMAQFSTDTGLSWEQAAAGGGSAQQQSDFQAILAANWQ